MGHCDNFVALEGRRTMFVAFWTKTGQLVTAHPKTIVLQRVRRQMGDHQGHSASRDQEVSSPQPNPPAMAIFRCAQNVLGVEAFTYQNWRKKQLMESIPRHPLKPPEVWRFR